MWHMLSIVTAISQQPIEICIFGSISWSRQDFKQAINVFESFNTYFNGAGDLSLRKFVSDQNSSHGHFEGIKP